MGRRKLKYGKPLNATVLEFITIYRETLIKTFKQQKGMFRLAAKCHPESGLNLETKDTKLKLSCQQCKKYMLEIVLQEPLELKACPQHKDGYRVMYTKDGLSLSCVTCKKKLNFNLEVAK